MNDLHMRNRMNDGSDGEQLDALLRRWHEVNAERAAAGRAALMERLDRVECPMTSAPSPLTSLPRPRTGRGRGGRVPTISALRPAIRTPYLRAAASFVLLIALLALLVPVSNNSAQAQQVIMLPEGGKLEALDAQGRILGPCALKHTDVHVAVSGPFTRVSVKQNYHNPYDRKIEAVYTFPLSHRAAVDRMTMTIGDRVIEAEMKERQQARQIYESARAAGHVASLLEQERPNIFTQSVANIEPKAQIVIEISYVEMLQARDGEHTFDFPMVVGPRYVPGYAIHAGRERHALPARLPNELERRDGIILLGPATFERLKLETAGEINTPQFTYSWLPQGAAPLVQEIIDASIPILPPDPAYRMREEMQDRLEARPGIDFHAIYGEGTKEFGQIAPDGLGHISGRWFYFEPTLLDQVERDATRQASTFANDTNQVPDASRITPMPVKPPMRAGHDISLSMTIDTGGPAITSIKSDLHEITGGDVLNNLGEPPQRLSLALKNQSEIPNRDFVLRWRTNDDTIEEAVFVHAPPAEKALDDKGGYFTLILAPPARVKPEDVPPRELIFVLDTSGSMSGLPIEKAKGVMSQAIETMRPRDTFNIITFSGDTHILWDRPRPNTEANRAEAQAFLASRSGSGGTEMMEAIEAALAPTNVGEPPKRLTAEQLANLPADGREVMVEIDADDVVPTLQDGAAPSAAEIRVREGLSIRARVKQWRLPGDFFAQGGRRDVVLKGLWRTIEGERVFDRVEAADLRRAEARLPVRIVMFLTDGHVGNDYAIIEAVKQHAKTTRVFSFAIGDAPNSFLLCGIAQAGRGDIEFVNLQTEADPIVERFVKRIETPVLTDIQLAFEGGIKVSDTVPPVDAIPDLFDVKPLIVHGRFAVEGATRQAGAGAQGKLRIRGETGAGAYERVIDLDFAGEAKANENGVIATLWARAQVEELMKRDYQAVQNGAPSPEVLKEVIALGERYSIMTNYTSFVAVEKARLTIAGQPMLVPVPIEFPEGMDWGGVFGGDCANQADARRAPADEAEMLNVELHREMSARSADEFRLRELFQEMRRLERTNGDRPQAQSKGKSEAEFSRQLGQQPHSITTTGSMQYPPDWPQMGARRTSGANRQLRLDASGRLAPAPGMPADPEGQIYFLQPGDREATDGFANVGLTPSQPLIDDLHLGFQNAPSLDLVTALDQGGGGRFGAALGSDSRVFSELAEEEQSHVDAEMSSRKSSQRMHEERTRIIDENFTRVAQLLAEKKFDEAAQVNDEILFMDPENVAANEMIKIIGTASQAAAAPLDTEVIDRLKREERLRRIIDSRLWRYVGLELPEANGESGAPTLTPALSLEMERELTVAILMSAVDKGTREALASAGLTIEDASERLRVVAGVIATDQLDDLALLECVRRIEPIE